MGFVLVMVKSRMDGEAFVSVLLWLIIVVHPVRLISANMEGLSLLSVYFDSFNLFLWALYSILRMQSCFLFWVYVSISDSFSVS